MEDLFELEDRTEAIIEAIGEAIIAEESEPEVINLPRMPQMFRAYYAVISMAWPSWKVTYSLHSPCTSMGVISVEAEDLTFEKLRLVQQVLNDASNVEIYPLVNGNLRMNITFHGVTKKLL